MKYTEKYRSGYNYTNLSRFRQLFLTFPILATVSQLSWSQLTILLPIKNENKRNYYINLCITNNLSVRELKQEIKNNVYERLINKPNKIEIIKPLRKYNLLDSIKNPIIIEVDKEEKLDSEHNLEIVILSKLQHFFKELGEGFIYVGNQYKILFNQKNYYLDILLFNYKLNCFVVIELKLRELKKEDKAQMEFYMQLVNEELKEPFHNKTIGIIISKKQDKLIANFIRSQEIIPLTYKIQKKEKVEKF